MPAYDPNQPYHKIFHTGEKQNPFKVDAKIKNYRRIFLRDMFTMWHDSNYTDTIESYADQHHPTIQWYRKYIDQTLSLEEIIRRDEAHVHSSLEEKFKWQQRYDSHKYHEYPYIIQKCIELHKLEGIEKQEDLDILDQIV